MYPDLSVLFVEPASDPLHDLRRRQRPRAPRLRSIDPARRLRTLRPFKLLPRRLGTAADVALHFQLRGAARAVGFRRPILWLNDVTYAPLSSRTGWPTLYDITDDWLLAPGSPREQERLRLLDGLALRNAAEVVVCSQGLARSRGAARPVTLIPNAVDVAHFQRPRERPSDLPPGPVAVYVGSLHDARLDVELVVALAQAIESLAIVLVGPNSLQGASCALLTAQRNVRLLGVRPYADIPAYLQHADVIVVPHVVDAFTDSLDPIKAYECLAVRRPVVATPVAGFRELRERLTVVDRGEFVTTVQATLAEGPSAQQAVEVPTWDERAEAFAEVLDRVSRSRQS